ncbi:hypothetical protein ACFE04_019518 [Oxalis oulophora]
MKDVEKPSKKRKQTEGGQSLPNMVHEIIEAHLAKALAELSLEKETKKDKQIRDLKIELEALRNEQDLAKKKYHQAILENFTLAQRNQQLKEVGKEVASRSEAVRLTEWERHVQDLENIGGLKNTKICFEASKLNSTAPPPTEESLRKFVNLVVNELGKMKLDERIMRCFV